MLYIEILFQISSNGRKIRQIGLLLELQIEVNDIQFNFVVEIHLFIDKKSGFIKNLLKSIIDLNYKKELIISKIFEIFVNSDLWLDCLSKFN